jgi:hypothetical protein
MAKPEVHHGCSRERGASQNVCPKLHSADTALGDCSPSKSWVSGGEAELAWHSSYTATKTIEISNMVHDYVNPTYI